ncbi:MAG: SurA N-terminal domain-containing protein [Candidatus Saccharimonadales bacterium]
MPDSQPNPTSWPQELKQGYDHGRKWAHNHRAGLRQGAKVIIVAVIVALAVAIVSIYGSGRQNRFTHVVSQIVPFPAAMVEGESLRYSVYLDQVRYLDGLIAYESPDADSTITQEQIDLQSIESLINAKIVELESYQRGLTVSAAEIDINLEHLYGSDTELSEQLASHGVGDDMVRRQVRTQILQFKLSQELDEQGEITEGESIIDWIAMRREAINIRYLLPQHGG